jgi:hypothetical protein
VPVFAQFETGEVLGTIRDQRNEVISKAAVSLLNQDTGITVKTTTDDTGNYNFAQVKPGNYTVKAEATGFSKALAADIRVDVNARQRVELTLQVGQVSEVVEVTGAAAAVETDSSQKGQVINTQQIVELPLNGRSYADLALLATNVKKSPMSGTFAANSTPREAAFNVNGMRSVFNNFLLDGLDNNAYSPSNQGYSSQVVQPSPDAVAEFKVIISNFSAEYGRVGGGVINAALRSGTNSYHGTAYEFLRNTELNAIGFTFSPTFFQKPTLQRNQFGFTVGGPFIKNKLFFFADYEGFRQLQRYLNTDSIPSLNERAGILPVAVTNPLTGATYAANTAIPVSQINPFAADVLKNLPTPTGPGRSSNFIALLLVKDYSDKYDAKLDYQLNSKMTSFLRFSQRKDIAFYAPDIPGLSGGGGNGFIHAIQQQAGIGYTWSVTPTSLLEGRFGFDHVLGGKVPPYIGGVSPSPLFPFAGLPTSPSLVGGLNTQNVSGYNAFGRQTSNPQFQNPTSFNPKVNFSLVKGRHSLKMGYELVVIRTEILDVNPLFGADNYSGQFSRPSASAPADATSYNLADFIFGLPSSIQLGNQFVSNARQHVNSLYVQDDFRVTPRLTLNLGLRWEYATPIWERDNNWTNFDPGTNTLVKASGGDIFQRALVHPDYKDFGPRIGMAYSFTPKTVMRGGYGISYSFFNRPGSAQEVINAPQALFGLLTQPSIPPGGPVPANFLTVTKSFTTGIADPKNFNPIVSNIDFIDPNTKWPYIQSWFFSIQQEVTKSTVVELAYNGNHSVRMPILGDFNQAFPNAVTPTCNPAATPPVTAGCLAVQARRPIQSFGAITWLTPQGQNDYNGFSARVEHRFTAGLYFLNSFTWSKALGNSEQALENNGTQSYYVANPQNIRNLSQERGPVSFDVKLMNVASVVYQLPFGRGRKFGSAMNPVFDAALGGWELNSIVTAQTGVPLDVSYSPAAANDVTALTNDYRGQAILRPNVSGNSISQSKGQLVNTYYAGYSFTTPLATSPFGNAGRDAFRAPGLGQWDLAVNKAFRIREGINLQFRSEFFNVTNHTNFGIPNSISTAAAFGQIRQTYPARQIQFALKLLY